MRYVGHRIPKLQIPLPVAVTLPAQTAQADVDAGG